ncbi:MAG: hypothetical protein WC558_00780 [Patulibacter sp.]
MPRIPTGRTAMVVLAATLALTLAGCGDDGQEIELVRGAPDAGFPLRGDLANDRDALIDAAEEWVEEDEDSDDRSVLDDDRELKITALWAGRVNDEDFAVLASDGHAALVGRPDTRDAHWNLRKTVSIREDYDPGVVAFSTAILLPEKTRSSPMLAEAGARRIKETDGLLHVSGPYAAELPSGVLYLPDGVPRRRDRSTEPSPVIVRTGTDGIAALRTVGPSLRSRLQPGTDAFDPSALRRFVAATTDVPGRGVERFGDPPVVDLVRDAPIPGVGPAMLIRSARSPTTSSERPSVALGMSGSSPADADEATTLLLGGSGAVDDPYRAASGPALGVGVVERATRDQALTGAGPAPLLVVAGDDDVASIEVQAGSRRWSGPGPILTVPISWNRGRKSDTDFVVLGRDADGRLIAPAAAADGLKTVRVDDDRP